MNPFVTTEEKARRLIRISLLMLAFLALTAAVFFALRQDPGLGGTGVQQSVYTLGGGLLIAAVATVWLHAVTGGNLPRWGRWFCPLVAAGLSFCLFSLSYSHLGIWPLGSKTVLMVDMHHQYAPLLSELRDLIIHGGSFSYSFHVGLGTNFISLFSYYLSSPLNFLLVLFPQRYLPEAILVITLLKNALAAGAFAACVQSLYKRRDAGVIALAVLYSLMMYMLAYSWNIMWLDVVALLPAVVLFLEKALNGGKWLPYALLLGLTLFANYYIGFMLCIFLVLYYLVWLIRQRRPFKAILTGTGKFAAGSLLAGALAAFILIPTALALGRTSAAGDTLPNFAANFPLFDLIGRLFFESTPTIRSGNLPNLYCGIPVLLLVPIYMSQRTIPLRRRLSYGALTAVMLISCTVNQWDLLWHGLHAPNDLPYRFSFLCCFVLLLLSAKALTELEQVRPAQILGGLTACLVYLAVWEKFNDQTAPKAAVLYANILLVIVYAGILLWNARRKMPVRAGRLLLLVAVTAELLVGTPYTLNAMDGNEYYTAHEDYLDRAEAACTAAAVEKAQELAAQEGGFRRMEFLPRHTCVDTALYHYNGITTFASSNPYDTTVFMGSMGYAVNGVNSYLYNSFVAPVDSLFGIRYLILDFEMTGHDQLRLLTSVTREGVTRYIYENKDALPAGFFADTAVREFNTRRYDPFGCHEELYTALLGRPVTLYEAVEQTVTAGSDAGSITGSSFYKEAGGSTLSLTANMTRSGQYFAYVDCQAADTISLSVYDKDGEMGDTFDVDGSESYILDLGPLEAGQRVESAISGDGSFSGNVYVMRLDTEAYETARQDLAAHGMTVDSANGDTITGSVNAPTDGVMFFSIPYDTGWTVTVDGKKAETFPIDADAAGDGALLGAVIPAGEHSVRLHYRAPGQFLGLAVSGAALVLTVVLILLGRRKKAAPAPTAPVDPDPTPTDAQ